MLIMLRKHTIKSWKYTKNMLKTESDTENKPKIYQTYTKFWVRVREAIAFMQRGVASLTVRWRGACRRRGLARAQVYCDRDTV